MTKTVSVFFKSGSSGGPNFNPYNAGGLAISAAYTVDALKQLGVEARLRPVAGFAGVQAALAADGRTDLAILEAVWVTPAQLEALVASNHHTHFVVRAHSKIGFLQVEPEAITPIRAIIAMDTPRIRFASNNAEFAQALTEAYGHTAYLPNLYNVIDAPARTRGPADGPLQIASFGATRLLKLHPNAALAALQVARRLRRGLTFYYNLDRTPGGQSVTSTIQNLLAGIPGVQAVGLPWQDALKFRRTIAGMDLVFQLSATETFCLVAADAVASGVPVVVSEAIDWLPEKWRVNADDPGAVANLAEATLEDDTYAARMQHNSLKNYIQGAVAVWARYLGVPVPKKSWWKF